ncbi:CopG family transcriptional regulator [Pseudoxanthomonas sp. UTMC 1351]|uniref:CopG family transcriptional regulator n=1 Tax=Pseudoxanthomonas sp. UTMC 1351 TaxID=2695853 RepID=UPI0034CDCB41
MRRVRRNIYFEPEHERGLDRLAAAHGLSVSAVVGRAVASMLSPDAEHRREAALTRRLDRLTRQFERLERDQTILIETLALHIRHYLSVTPPLPEAHVEAARAQGRARFEQFIEQLALHLRRGLRVRDAIEEWVPAEDAFVEADDGNGALGA